MKAYLLSFVIVCAFVGASFGAKDMDKVLSNKTIAAVYSMPSKVWLEGVYNVGKPTAKIYAYLAFESPYIASSAGFGVAGLKVGKDLLVGVAQEYIENPAGVCDNLSDALMSVGMDSYRRNYTRYKSYKATGVMSSEDFKAFLEDNHNVNYLGLGRDLFADVQAYKHRQGKYSLEKEFAASWKGAKALLDEVDNVKGSTESPSTLGTLKEIVGVAQANLASYPPYRDHLARVKQLENKMDTEFPLAKPEGVVEPVVEEVKEKPSERWTPPKLKNPPDRPVTKSIYDAMELANIPEFWSHLYYKTCYLKGTRTRHPVLYALLEAENSDRLRKLLDLQQKDAKFVNDLYHSGKHQELYNLTKSPEYAYMLLMLIENGRVNVNMNPPIRLGSLLGATVSMQNFDAIPILVNAGTEVTRDALDKTNKIGYDNLLGYLVKNGKKIDRTALLFDYVNDKRYRKDGDYKVVQLLIDYGAKINSLDKYGCSPLYCAVDNKDLKMVTLLLRNGADVNLKGKGGRLPIEAAKGTGDRVLIKMLEDGAGVVAEEPVVEKPVETKTAPSSGGMDNMDESAKREETVKIMKRLERDLRIYKFYNLHYPTAEETLDALVGYDRASLYKAKSVPKDAWGNNFVYFVKPREGVPFAILSFGADGVKGGANDDDIWVYGN